jgi:hypothetical protein
VIDQALLTCLLALFAADGGTTEPDAAAADGAADRGAAAPDGGVAADLAPDGATDVVQPPPAPPARTPVPTVRQTGQVLSRGSRDPLVGVSIAVDGQTAGETDAEGRFVLELPPGRHRLQIQFPGHAPYSQSIDAGANQALLLRLEPTRAPGQFETVVRAPAVEASTIRLEKSEITMTPGSLGDPFRVIESLPGVVPVMWPLAIYAVRGSNPGNTGFFLDGLRVPGLFHFALGPAVIHPYFLESLDFYPGGYPPQYGRYVGGIVSSHTAAPPADRLRGTVDVRLFDAGMMLSSPIDGGKGTAAVAARYAYPMLLLSKLQDDVTLHYWDYQARIDHDLGPGRITLLAFGSYDSLNALDDDPGDPGTGSSGGEDHARLLFHRLDLRWRGGLGGGRLFVGLGAGMDETSAPYEDDEFAVRSQTLLPRLSFERPLGRAVDLMVGVDGELSDYETELGDADPNTASTILAPRQAQLLAGYSQLILRLGEQVVLSPGFRVDRYREGGVTEVDYGPRLAARVRVHPQLWLKAGGGRATQMASLPLQLPGFEGFGLAQHGLQRAWQGSLGAEAALAGSLDLDVNGFIQRSRLTDMRDPDVGDDPLTSDFLVNREALAYGVELMLRRNPRERLHGWVTYTLSRSLRAFEGGVVGPADWDQRHVINVVAGYRWQRYTLGGRFHLHTGRMVKVGSTTPVEFDRLPPFYQFDVRLDRRFIFDRYRLDLYAEVVNTTLSRQTVSLDRGGGETTSDGFRIFLPSLGIRAEF